MRWRRAGVKVLDRERNCVFFFVRVCVREREITVSVIVLDFSIWTYINVYLYGKWVWVWLCEVAVILCIYMCVSIGLLCAAVWERHLRMHLSLWTLSLSLSSPLSLTHTLKTERIFTRKYFFNFFYFSLSNFFLFIY